MTRLRPLYGWEIRNIATSDPEIAAFFKGVIAWDQIHLIKECNFPATFILNSDNSDGKGEHWVLIFLTNKNLAIFFDSLSLPLQIYSDLFLILLKKCQAVLIAPYRVQSLESSACGYHTLFFLYLLKIFSPKEIFTDIYMKGRCEFNDFLANFYLRHLLMQSSHGAI